VRYAETSPMTPNRAFKTTKVNGRTGWKAVY
jgi:hypothetical protein